MECKNNAEILGQKSKEYKQITNGSDQMHCIKPFVNNTYDSPFREYFSSVNMELYKENKYS